MFLSRWENNTDLVVDGLAEAHLLGTFLLDGDTEGVNVLLCDLPRRLECGHDRLEPVDISKLRTNNNISSGTVHGKIQCLSASSSETA